MNSAIIYEIQRQNKNKERRLQAQLVNLNNKKKQKMILLEKNPDSKMLQTEITALDRQIHNIDIQIKKVKRMYL